MTLFSASLSYSAKVSKDSKISGNLSKSCVRGRIALDVGSGTSKVRAGIINICTQRIIKEIRNEEGKTIMPSVALGFKDHLASRPENDKTFTAKFMDEAESQIANLVASAEAKIKLRLQSDSDLKSYSYLAKHPFEVAGVATEAFRQAKNAVEFINKLSKDHNIKINIISQAKEGHLGFMGVMSALGLKRNLTSNSTSVLASNTKANNDVNANTNTEVKTKASANSIANSISNSKTKLKSNLESQNKIDPSKIISWDIGGGSLQVVGYNGVMASTEQNAWFDFGNKLASIPMKIFINKEFKKLEPFTADNKAVSPNPIIDPSLDQSQKLIKRKKLMELAQQKVIEEMRELTSADWFRSALEATNPRTVYGIGGVHKGIFDFLKSLKENGHGKNNDSVRENVVGYKLKDLDSLLDTVLFKTDAELVKEFGLKEEYTSVIVTNILLVRTIMEVMKINQVEVLDVDNTYGVMVAPMFWKAVADLPASQGALNP